jgi:hypothetical protein
MKRTTLFICLFVTAVTFAAGLKTGQPNDLQKTNYDTLEYKVKLIKAYEEYYKATENFLDTLEDHYGWVDAFDPRYYLDARHKVDSLLELK